MRKILLFIASLLSLSAAAQQRTEINLSDQWEFSRDSIHWEQVTVPHDWAIAGPFDKKWDLQFVAIEQNGEKEKTEKSGRSGSLPWIGKGFYRTTVRLDEVPASAFLCFDGAMSEPVVYVNGRIAGRWAYGYNAFRMDVARLLRKGDNRIAVTLQNVEESSRWYPGGGIYRPVTLIVAGKGMLNDWATYFRTVDIHDDTAEIEVGCGAVGDYTTGLVAAEITLRDDKGRVVAACHSALDADGKFKDRIHLRKAKLWSPETPYLYTLETTLYRDLQVIDRKEIKVGVRTIKVDKEKGFQLNGVTRKIKGVCLHHDLGPLGAAVNKAALIRQVRTMKEMGCDAIRTAHNMPSTMQMEVCDSMGMMVMAESFDMWIYPKCKNGYARFFKEWADRDITNLVLNHRNHPSIIMWSIGNEIPEQWSEEGREISRHLQQICHDLDPSRPVTQGMDKAEAALKSGFAQVMDVPGFNYRVHKYENNIKQLPQGFLLGSETASTVSSRGVYKFPVEVSDHAVYDDGQCSSYDTEYCSWSNLPDDDWKMQDDYPWVIGEFVWTGYDYLGEPTPYDEYWPSRSSYFGICDLAGLPKDRYYLYRSKWNKESHTLHVLPHWTWPGREGKVTPVYCYTDYPSAELFVNGKSQGRIFKNPGSRLDRYRLRWNEVKYQPGEIKVVAYDADGRKADEKVVRTAGKPHALVLTPDRQRIAADGNDLCFITVTMVDQDGNMVPDADHQLTFEVEGQGMFKAACNGDATSLEPFTQPTMRLFHGQLVLVVQAAKSKGGITIRVSDAKKRVSPSEIRISAE
ncbi:MAG: DUF4982 domain-containing protein [Prevotella sp.]|nr:DUF4982 domain-containing protein [Prevotella sp.]